MAGPIFDAERACEVLLDAAFLTDGKAAEKHSVSRRTVINYRKRLRSDANFALLFTQKLNEIRAQTDWEERLPATLRKALTAAEQCFEKLPKQSPESLRAISEAVATLADALLTLRMLDARLADQAGAEAPADRQVFGSSHGVA